MGLFNDSMQYAAQTTAAQGGDFTFGEKAGGVVAGAVISGLGSIYNTGVAVTNALGGDAEKLSTYDTLQGMDEGAAEYYKQNAHAIDTAGFIGTSFVPGLLAIKGLNAVRAGAANNAFGSALNLARTNQTRLLSQASAELALEGGSVFTRINANKLGMIGWEAADQALQAATFELAVALTMKQSPLLADDSWWDIGKNIATGAIFGGVVGGGIGALAINKGFKEGAKALSLRSNEYTALSGLENVGLSQGDQAFGLIDSVLRIPPEVLDQHKFLELSFKLGSGPTALTNKVDVSQVLQNVAKQSSKSAMLEFETTLRKLTGTAGDRADVADPLAEFVLARFNTMRTAGADPSAIRERMGDYLWNLKKVVAATDDPLYLPKDLTYFKKNFSPEEIATFKTVQDFEAASMRSTPFGDAASKLQAYDKPYIFTGTPEQKGALELAIIGGQGEHSFPSLKAAWEAGYHVAKQPDGALRVNTTGGLWKRVEDPVYDPRRYLNTRTGTLSEDAVLTAADRAVAGSKLVISNDGVEVMTTAGIKRERMSAGFKEKGSIEYVTARHAWASKLADDLVPEVIDIRDISLIERAAKLSTEQLAERQIKHLDGALVEATGLKESLVSIKVDAAQAAFSAGTHDVRELAYRLAVDESWIEKVVGAEFGTAVKSLDGLVEGSSRDLASFMNRENLVATFKTPDQFVGLQNAQAAGLSPAAQRLSIMADVAQNGGQFVTGEMAYAYRVQGAIRANMNAAGSVLGAEKLSQLIKLDQSAAKLADTLGAGASFLGAANASYGETLRLAAQDIGKKVHQWLGESSDMVASSFNTAGQRLQQNSKAAAEVGIITNILRNDEGKFVLDIANPKRLILREMAQARTPEALARIEETLKAAGRRTSIDVLEQDAMDFLNIHRELHGTRVEKNKVLFNARGFTSNHDANVFYAPPVDTTYYQHFMLVKGIEGKAFGTSETSMIFGRTAAELQQRAAAVDKTLFEVISKDGTERYFKAKGTYDFSQTINERVIDSSLRRTGALANHFPETRAQNIIEDYLRYNQNQESKLIRNAVESNYSQQISELSALGRSYVEDATSKFQGTLRSAKSEIVNPYDDVIKTMMDVSKRSEYQFFHQANEFVDALGTRAYQVLADVTGKAQKGLISFTEANRIAEQHGLRGVYSSDATYFLSNAPRDRNLIKEYIAKANSLLGNLVLRFDTAQAMMNVISTPLLLGTELASIRQLVTKDSALTGALNELTRIGVPGTQASVPSTMKLLGNAIKNYHGPDKAALVKRYVDNGDIKGISSLMHEAIGDLGMNPNFKVFSEGVDRAADKIGKITGNNWAEEFTRFVSADVMRQVTDPLVAAGKLELTAQNAYISTFVNRVQGNYVTSQRPVVFQGVLGGAISLFQTYSFNLMQQLFRHIEDGNGRAVGTLFGMQAGLFGLNGLPFFDAVNTHLVGNAGTNLGHHDAYSLAPALVGKSYGDWLMYGTVSAFPAFGDKWPALYSRGDINPRHMSILPIVPTDIPAIDASIRVVKNLVDVGSKLVKGADISETLLQGLEHNGLNRPLAGMAQALMGHSTTSKGSLISANSDMELIATGARIIGAKPMDEAVLLNNMYRIKAYQVADQARREALGERVKTKLIGNQVPTTEEYQGFMKDYAAVGGRMEGFNASIIKWSRDANTSVIRQMTDRANTPYAKRLTEISGGVPLEDYRNSRAAQVVASENPPPVE